MRSSSSSVEGGVQACSSSSSVLLLVVCELLTGLVLDHGLDVLQHRLVPARQAAPPAPSPTTPPSSSPAMTDLRKAACMPHLPISVLPVSLGTHGPGTPPAPPPTHHRTRHNRQAEGIN